MGEGRTDDEMIEIGDPTEEPTAPEPPPRVVIEYRERGVPWMLVPPLLVISAVLAVGGYLALDRRARRERGPELALATSPPVAVPAPPPVAVKLPVEPPAPAPPKPEPPAPELAKVEPAPTGPVPTEPEVPKVEGIGFDPRALEADREAPPVDPAVAPAQGPRPDEPLPVMPPVAEAQPEEVDPDLLPPDPKLARVRRLQRLAELKRQADADRARFHAELLGVCRKFKANAGPEIVRLCKRFDAEPDPAMLELVAKQLAGPYAGADRGLRIRLLRSAGVPEAKILQDVFQFDQGKQDLNSRYGPRSADQVWYNAAMTLLRYPPPQVGSAATSRPSASPVAAFGTRSPTGGAPGR